MSDTFVGTRDLQFAVYSGRSQGRQLRYTPHEATKRVERVGWRGCIPGLHANKREEIDANLRGGYSRVRGPERACTTGDTLCDERQSRGFSRACEFPRAKYISVTRSKPKEPKADQDQAGQTPCKSLAQEDPTFRVHSDEDTGQTVSSGMGELHLEII